MSENTTERRLWLDHLAVSGMMAAILLISALHHLTATSPVYWHNLYQILYYLPTLLGALLFGWRTALVFGLTAGISHIPYILQAARDSSDYAVEQAVEMPLLCIVGLLTGILSDRDRGQRTDLHRTTTRLTEVYQELQQNFEQMKRAERLFAVGQLAAGLAHELRNPLWSISGAVGILQRNAHLEPKHLECLEIIYKESQRLSRLLTDFLDFARPRPPKYQKFNVEALLNSVIQISAHGAERNAISLRKEVSPDLPPIQGDPEMIKQLLLNLVINAIQAMPEGGEIVLYAGIEGEDLLIRVQDEGCGITSEIKDKMFDPFFTTKEEGTGLGLAVAHQIVEQHGGMLKAEANPGKGTTFSVAIPVRREVLG